MSLRSVLLALLAVSSAGCELALGLDSYRPADAGSADAIGDGGGGEIMLTIDDLLGGDVGITLGSGGTYDCTPTEPCGPILVQRGDTIDLRATGDAAHAFTAWTGACATMTTSLCRLTAGATDLRIGVVFDVRQHLVSIARTGAGSGLVRTLDDVHRCDDVSCETFRVPHGTTLELSAEPDVGSTFVRWTAAGCDTAPTCSVTVTSPITIAADFGVTIYDLTTVVTGSGAVSGTGIGCRQASGDCAQSLGHGTVATLTASADAGHLFTGWDGCDRTPDAATCELTMLSDRTVTASFSPLRGLNVSLRGSGKVRSSPFGISCGDGGACTADFTAGTLVTLTPTADLGHHFVEWAADCGGATCACSGTAPSCVHSVGAASAFAAAVFAPDPHTIVLDRTGTGAPAGVIRDEVGEVCSAAACPTIDTETGRTHTFTASVDYRASFDGWTCVSGDCASCDGSTAPCTVMVSRDTILRARFSERRYDATVSVVAMGAPAPPATALRPLAADETGSSPLVVATGISCGGVGVDCSENVAGGARIRFALTTPWLRLVSWGHPGCSDALPECDLLITTDTTLAVRLEQVGNLAFVTEATFLGDFGGPGGIDAARARCEEAATAAGLPRAAYRALLATGVGAAGGPAIQLTPGSGDRAGGPAAGFGMGWVNVRGDLIATTPAEVAEARLVHAILTERGALLPWSELTWTGAHGGYAILPAGGLTVPTPLPSGYPAGSVSYARCSDPSVEAPWGTTALSGITVWGGVGGASVVGSAVFGAFHAGPPHPPPPTPGYYPNIVPCTAREHLYCFESSAVTYAAPTPPAPTDAIVIFSHGNVSTSPGALGGRAAMDAACQADADSHSLSGRYVALVGSAALGEAALDRITRSGPVFRPDGFRVADDVSMLAATAADATARTPPGSLAAGPGGTWVSSPGYLAVTGFSSAGAGAVPDATEDCAGYTSTSGNTAYGITDGLRFGRWGREGVVPCSSFRPLTWYCVRAD